MRTARTVSVLGLALALAVPVAADDPKPDPLPKGATLRLGDDRLALSNAQSLTLRPPDYQAFVLPELNAGLRAFDLATARPVEPAGKPARSLVAAPAAASADGKRFAVTNPSNGTLTVREAATGKEVKQLKPPAGFDPRTYYGNYSLSADGARAALGGTGAGNKGSVVVWDVDKGEVLFTSGDGPEGAFVPVLSPDGKRVAARGAGPPPAGKAGEPLRHEVRVYEVDGGKELSRAAATPVPYIGLFALAFSPDGSALAGSFGGGVVDVWDVATGKARPPLLGRAGQGRHLAFSPDGKVLAAVGADGTVQRWAAADGKPLGTTDSPLPPAVNLAPLGLVFADGERVRAWGAADSCPVVWEAPSGKLLTPLPEHTSQIRSIAFAAGGREVLTAGSDGRVVRWDAATGKALGPVALRPASARFGGPVRLPVDLSPDGTRAVSAYVPPTVFDLKTGTEEFALPVGVPGGYSITTTPSADLTKVVVVTSPFDRATPTACAAWDLVARRKLVEVQLPTTPGSPPAAAVSPSGKRLVTAAYAAPRPGALPPLVVTGWDAATGRKLGEVQDVTARGPVAVAAADDTYAVVASNGGRLRVFDYEDGKGGDELEAGNKFGGGVPPGPMAFSPDGKRFAAAAPQPTTEGFVVKVHDWATGKVSHTFAGHRRLVTALAFSPDGRTLASGSLDTTVLLWDLAAVEK